jgi:hypothetical protein
MTLIGRITGMAPNGGLQRDVIAHLAGCNGPPTIGDWSMTHDVPHAGAAPRHGHPSKGNVQVVVTIPPSGVMHFLYKFHMALGMNGARLSGNATLQAVFQGATHGTDGESRD